MDGYGEKKEGRDGDGTAHFKSELENKLCDSNRLSNFNMKCLDAQLHTHTDTRHSIQQINKRVNVNDATNTYSTTTARHRHVSLLDGLML